MSAVIPALLPTCFLCCCPWWLGPPTRLPLTMCSPFLLAPHHSVEAELPPCLHFKGQKLEQLQQCCGAFPFLVVIRQVSKQDRAVVSAEITRAGMPWKRIVWEQELYQCRQYPTSGTCGMETSWSYGVCMGIVNCPKGWTIGKHFPISWSSADALSKNRYKNLYFWDYGFPIIKKPKCKVTYHLCTVLRGGTASPKAPLSHLIQPVQQPFCFTCSFL